MNTLRAPWAARLVPKASEDSVMVIDLGQAGDVSRFLFLGHREKLPTSSAVII